MNEAQVTVEGTTYPLPDPFLVIATENPVEYQGTYPLPEAQLDRFAMMLDLGYPSKKDELEIVESRRKTDPLDALEPVVDDKTIKSFRAKVGEVEMDSSIADYMVEIARATREDPRVKLGASPRALLTLSRCARAKAFLLGRAHLLPDDVKSLATVVIAHRLVLENKIKYGGVEKREVFQDILDKVRVPV
jgi:MoxR-like ATPase